MKSRKLLDGITVKELEEVTDMETGEEYIGYLPEDTKYHWKKITS